MIYEISFTPYGSDQGSMEGISLEEAHSLLKEIDVQSSPCLLHDHAILLEHRGTLNDLHKSLFKAFHLRNIQVFAMEVSKNADHLPVDTYSEWLMKRKP